MSPLQTAVTIALYALAAASWLGTSKDKRAPRQPSRRPRPLEDQSGRVRITCESSEDGTRMVRMRGPLNDVLDALHGRAPEEAPPLPEDLDWRALPKYRFGCPHCRRSSLYGESLWMYGVVERTRDRWDNTTTYLARCRGCRGLMRATVDHDD